MESLVKRKIKLTNLNIFFFCKDRYWSVPLLENRAFPVSFLFLVFLLVTRTNPKQLNPNETNPNVFVWIPNEFDSICCDSRRWDSIRESISSWINLNKRGHQVYSRCVWINLHGGN